MIRHILHYGIHFFVPLLVAIFFFKENRLKVALILISAIAIDIDHLLSQPIFDANRCSIGFHPLHSYVMIPIYIGLAFWKRTRLLGLALVIHIIADSVDCLFIRP
ncbi:MAG: DUF6122 family protein [Croceivirga sp.]